MQPWVSWQDKRRLWEAFTFLRLVRLVRPGPLSVYPIRLSSRALIMGGEWVSHHRRKMGWDLRSKMSQDHPSLPPSQSPCCEGPHWSAAPSTPPPQTSPSAWMPATPTPHSQQLNSSRSSFNPQINHHLFCKASPIFQAEFNTSAPHIFFFLKQTESWDYVPGSF